jgi:hypothetical protein
MRRKSLDFLMLLLAQTVFAAADAPQLDAETFRANACPDAMHCGRGDFVELAKGLAGERSLDCGDVQLGKDRSLALDCVKSALGGNRPFFAFFDIKGIDSSLSKAVVRTGNGNLLVMLWDSAVNGDPINSEPAIFVKECRSVSIDLEKHDLFVCEPTAA